MKKIMKIFLSLALVCMLFGIFGSNVLAEEGVPYKYTITVSAGNKGTINGESKVVLTKELAAGNSMTVDVNGLVTLTDDKYYIKGIRISGHDNEEALVSPEIQGDGDKDYVVAYGVKGDMVAYTVNYQDAVGNALLPSTTLYGNPGDKPVVAYHYIENFVPQALAMTKTLSDNPTDNVFTFVYTPGTTGTVTETTTPAVTIIDNTPVPQPGDAGTTGNAADAGTGGAQPDAGTTQTIPDEETPQALVDLDDEEIPASDMKLDEEKTAKKIPLAIAIAIIAAALAGLTTLIIVLKKRAK